MIHITPTVEIQFKGRALGRFTRSELAELSAELSRLVVGYDSAVDRILRAVAAHFSIDSALFRAGRREDWIVWPRHLAIFLVARETELPDDRVGSIFDRSRDLVQYVRRAVPARVATERHCREDLAAVERALKT